MKKLIIAAVILLVLGILAYAFFGGKSAPAETGKPAPTETSTRPETGAPSADAADAQTPANTEEQTPAGTEEQTPAVLDLEAMYASREPDEIVMTIDGKPLTWQDYFYFYQIQAGQWEQQFQLYQAYGMALGWDSQADEEGHTFAELLGPGTEDLLRQFYAMESLADDLGVEFTEEEQAELQQNHQAFITGRFGEEGTEDQFWEFLDSIHVSRDLYWRINSYDFLYNACMRELCGENGEKLEEQEILAWMEDNGILSADHILISTADLEGAEKEEKAALAQKIAEELQAIEDVEKRFARFQELLAEYSEDPGGVDGYVFGPGVMVQEFYDGTLALEENQVSDPVESQFGYHIILRRPLHAEDEILAGYESYTGRQMLANERFNNAFDQKMESIQIVYADGFQAPDPRDFMSTTPVEG